MCKIDKNTKIVLYLDLKNTAYQIKSRFQHYRNTPSAYFYEYSHRNPNVEQQREGLPDTVP